MRVSCDVYIEIDLIRAIENNIPFFISSNSVILTPGNNNGVLPFEFFRKVKNKQNQILFAQEYDYLLYIDFATNQGESLKKLVIIDVNNRAILTQFELDSFPNQCEIINNQVLLYMVENGLFKEKISVLINKQQISLYNSFINKNLQNLKYKSFFCGYLALDLANKNETTEKILETWYFPLIFNIYIYK